MRTPLHSSTNNKSSIADLKFRNNRNSDTTIEGNESFAIMTVEEVAQYFRKSVSWVYKNWEVLGGKKLGGSLIFPAKEDLYERIFSERQRVEVRLHDERNPVLESLVQNNERRTKCRNRKEEKISKSERGNGDRNRHGLLGIGKQKT